MKYSIDPALSEYEAIGHIVADLDAIDAASPAPLQWTSRPARRRAAPRPRAVASAARLLGATLVILLLLAAIACGDATTPTRTPASRPVASGPLSPVVQTLEVVGAEKLSRSMYALRPVGTVSIAGLHAGEVGSRHRPNKGALYCA